MVKFIEAGLISHIQKINRCSVHKPAGGAPIRIPLCASASGLAGSWPLARAQEIAINTVTNALRTYPELLFDIQVKWQGNMVKMVTPLFPRTLIGSRAAWKGIAKGVG